MASKLSKFSQKIFGSQAGLNQLVKFGSLAAGSPEYTTDPNAVQSLGNFLVGWYAATINGASPAKQDVNALFFLITRQIAYIFQSGIAEWDSSTEYFIGSYANIAGVQYVSKIDNNIGNNPATDAVNWRLYSVLPTGALMPTVATAAGAGFVLASGRTIGDASSGGTERANNDCFDLFSLIWTNYLDADYPIQNSDGSAATRGATALTDWNLHKRITLFDLRDRSIIGKGNMGGSAAGRITTGASSLDTTKLGNAGGSEVSSHNHYMDHTHTGYTGGDNSDVNIDYGGGHNGAVATAGHSHGVQTYGASMTNTGNTSPTIVQPGFVANVLIKL